MVVKLFLQIVKAYPRILTQYHLLNCNNWLMPLISDWDPELSLGKYFLIYFW